MRQVTWLNSAVDDLVRLREFVAVNNPQAAKNAAQTIKEAALKLEELPNIGKPVVDLPDYRDLYIKFGAAGYVMRYRIHQADVYIVHVRHYSEFGFNIC
jgi:plasmid stabilization system protein ParE